MPHGRPAFAWEEWVLDAAVAVLFLGVGGLPLVLLLGTGLWLRACLTAVVAAVVLLRVVSAFGRSYPEETGVDRMMRRFRRELNRDLRRFG